MTAPVVTLPVGQFRVAKYVRDYIAQHGMAPTLRECGAALGIRSTNGIAEHLNRLERKGVIARDDYKSRSMRVVGRFRCQGEGTVEEPVREPFESERAHVVSYLRRMAERHAEMAAAVLRGAADAIAVGEHREEHEPTQEVDRLQAIRERVEARGDDA